MGKEYDISKTTGQCCGCGGDFQPGQPFVATVTEGEEDFQREDFCEACWKGDRSEDSPEVFGVWRARIPQPQEKKKKLFVDDEVLINFFERLEGAEEAAKVSFRFVLALVLMRKKLLVYDRTEKPPDGKDVWIVHFRGGEGAWRVIDPHMDEEKVAEVSRHLGGILEAEL